MPVAFLHDEGIQSGSVIHKAQEDEVNVQHATNFNLICETVKHSSHVLKDDCIDGKDEPLLRRPASHARVLRPDHQLRQGKS